VRENETHVIVLCETWLQSSDCLFIPVCYVIRWDRPGGHGGGVLGFRRFFEFEKVLSTQISSCEMIAASVENINGQKLSIVSAYGPPNCHIRSEDVGDAFPYWFLVTLILTASLGDVIQMILEPGLCRLWLMT
jgi:hypothetical protein